MAFLKTGTAPAEKIEPAGLENFSRQAQETCQGCGYKMGRDETGTPVCRRDGCAKAVTA